VVEHFLLIISSKLDFRDLKEATRLARYRFAFLLNLVVENHFWIIGFAAVALTLTNLYGNTRESWKGILGLYVLVVGAFALRSFWMDRILRNRVRKMNRNEVQIELKADGVYFRSADGSLRRAPWERYLEARLGKRVLMLFYLPEGARRRKYFIVPLHGLSLSERNEVLLALPERLRSKRIREALSRWRMA
jgi:hypothetical protein